MSPDASDPSPSPEPGTEQDEPSMPDPKRESPSTEDKSPVRENAKPATKSNAKDPSRPRRKKARRACYACQRAHLTCGDERPCTRCIKRGLQDQCADGVRKKAKYLHDAPAEALNPGYTSNYANASKSVANVPGVATASPGALPLAQPANYFAPNASSGNYQYGSDASQGQVNGPMMDQSNMMSEYSARRSIGAAPQYSAGSNSQISPVQELSGALGPSNSLNGGGGHAYDNAMMDPNDHSAFGFNISDFNFGNRYGALEFGMLGHISSGAMNTPEFDSINSLNQLGHVPYDSYTPAFGYNQTFPSWQPLPNPNSRQNSSNNIWPQEPVSDAYAIGEQPPSLTGASPHSQNQDHGGYQSAAVSPETAYAQPDVNQPQDLLRHTLTSSQQHSRKQNSFPGQPDHSGQRKHRRDTSEIYNSIKAPYSYTQGFHALTAFLQKRYPSGKVLRIAKALATIRPSFISCNKHLNQDDLIFMEKCFQRTLHEYEDFISHYGTPTIICRRTGEIAAVSKEFCMLTGWKKDVLHGKEPNLNINTGGTSSGTQTGTSSRGAATPRISALDADAGRPQAVFLAELLDEDSVVKFYEDFSVIAFGASRMSVVGTPCSLLKYRTKEDSTWGPNPHLNNDEKRMKPPNEPKSDPFIKGTAGMNALGDRDGQVKCIMCWTIKRDVFDIPMLIVMNFLPII